MPEETRRSAVSRMSLSVTLPAKKFQLFQPMGGVAAMDLFWPKAATGRRRRSVMRKRWAGRATGCIWFSPLDCYRGSLAERAGVVAMECRFCRLGRTTGGVMGDAVRGFKRWFVAGVLIAFSGEGVVSAQNPADWT